MGFSRSLRRRVMAVAWLLGVLVGGGSPVPVGEASRDPWLVGERVVENLLARPFMEYPERGLHYAEVAAALGALEWCEAAGRADLRERLVARYTPILTPDSPWVSSLPHVDQAVIGALPLRLSRLQEAPVARRLGLAMADAQWANPRPDGLTVQTRWWIDDLFMIGALQLEAYRVTGNETYRDRAAEQVVAYLKKLQRPNGLFFHGPEAPIFWGRGNGWVAAGLTVVLEALPTEHPARPALLAGYRQMMATLRDRQGADGLWHQILDDPTAWGETSCTAMFASAMAVGLRRGWLEEAGYRPSVERAWAALCAQLDPAGDLGEICVGTGQNGDPQYYLDRPRHRGDLHGQAPLLWLATEELRRAR